MTFGWPKNIAIAVVFSFAILLMVSTSGTMLAQDTANVSAGAIASHSPTKLHKQHSSASSKYQIIRDVNGAGGNPMAGNTIRMHGTVSQTAIGRLRRPNNFQHNVGFWYWAAKKTNESFACLRFPVAEAEPGTVLSIPLLIEDPTGLPTDGTLRFRARVRYNRTLLQPVEGTPDCLWDGDDCVLEIEGAVTAEALRTGVLAELRFLAKLGNVESTPLTIEEVTWGGAGERYIRTVLKPGQFNLLGICRVNGEIRLIHSSGPSARVRVWPNPASENLNIEFVSREEGSVRLTLVDALGRDVALLAEQEVEAIKLYRVGVNIESIASGSYFLVLRTPTEIKTTRLTIEQ